MLPQTVVKSSSWVGRTVRFVLIAGAGVTPKPDIVLRGNAFRLFGPCTGRLLLRIAPVTQVQVWTVFGKAAPAPVGHGMKQAGLRAAPGALGWRLRVAACCADVQALVERGGQKVVYLGHRFRQCWPPPAC